MTLFVARQFAGVSYTRLGRVVFRAHLGERVVIVVVFFNDKFCDPEIQDLDDRGKIRTLLDDDVRGLQVAMD